MAKRTRLILIISIILALVIISGVAIGAQRGWFKGLADAIQGGTGSATIKVKVIDANRQPLEGVSAYWIQGNFPQKDETCGNDLTDVNPWSGNQGGTTAKKGDGIYSKFTISVPDPNSLEWNFRVDFGNYKSCAFDFVADMSTGSVVPGYNGHGAKIWGLKAGSLTTLTFRLNPGSGGGGGPGTGKGVISGKVTFGGSNDPVVGATVQLLSGSGVFQKETTTNTDGSYSFSGLEPTDIAHTYQVQVKEKECLNSGADAINVKVEPNKTSEQNFVVIRATVPSGKARIYGTVKDLITGAALPGTKMTLTAESTGEALLSGITTDENGFYSFCPVPTDKGRIVVSASKEGYPSASETISVSSGQEREVNFNLLKEGQSFNISGRVLDGGNCTSQTSGLDGVTIKVLDRDGDVLTRDDGSFVSARTDTNGYYKIDNVPLKNSSGKTPQSLRAEKTGYSDGVVKPLSVNGQDLTLPDILLYQEGAEDEISGKVTTDSGRVLAGAKIYLRKTGGKPIAETNNNGDFRAKLGSRLFGKSVKLIAVYEENGQKYQGEWSGVLECHLAINIIITIGQGQGGREVYVWVVKDGAGVNGADVVLEIKQPNGEYREAGSKKTQEMKVPSQDKKKDGVAKFSVPNNSTFRFNATKKIKAEWLAGKSEPYSLPPFNPENEIAQVKLIGEEAEPGKPVTVTYHFKLSQKIDRGDSFMKEFLDRIGKNLGDWKRALNLIWNPFYRAHVISDEVYYWFTRFSNRGKQEPPSPFYKIDAGGKMGFFKRSLWSFKIAEWKLSDQIQKLIQKSPAEGGIDLDWGDLGFKKDAFDAGSLSGTRAHQSDTYTVKVTFPDEETARRLGPELFCHEGKFDPLNPGEIINDRNLNLTVDTNGDRDKIKYSPIKVSCRGQGSKKVSRNEYEISVILRYALTQRFVNELENQQKSAIIDLGRGILSSAEENYLQKNRWDLFFKSSGWNLLLQKYGQNLEGSSSQDTQAAEQVGSYPLEFGSAFLGQLEPGNYRFSLDGTSKYTVDSRKNSFELKADDQTLTIESPPCYNSVSAFDSGLGFSLRAFANPNYQSEETFKDASLESAAVAQKAKVNNFLLVSDTAADYLNSANHFEGVLKYCRINKRYPADPEAKPQDEKVSGRTVVIDAALLDELSKDSQGVELSYLLSGKIAQESAHFIYNDLSDNERDSWHKLYRTIDDTDNPDEIYNLVLDASLIEKYVNVARLYSNGDEFYSLLASTYKENGAILKAEIEAMDDGREKDVMKALVRFIIETAGANPGDEALYQPIQGKEVSQAGYSSAVILSGDLYQEKLSFGKKMVISWQSFTAGIRNNWAVIWLESTASSIFNRLTGRKDNGRAEVSVLLQGRPGKDAQVVATDSSGEKKVTCSTNTQGVCTLSLPAGSYYFQVKEKKTGKYFSLQDTELKTEILKGKSEVLIIRLTGGYEED